MGFVFLGFLLLIIFSNNLVNVAGCLQSRELCFLNILTGFFMMHLKVFKILVVNAFLPLSHIH